MRRLGIDLGTVRTGVAIAEGDVPVATPLCTVAHRTLGQAVEAIAALAEREQVAELVVGLPLPLSGREGQAALRARRFASELHARARLPVRLWDERLSTAAAERSLKQQGMRREARREVVDQVAATLLLQSYLDSRAARDAGRRDIESG